MKRLPVLILVLCAVQAHATEPCRPDSAYSNPQLSGADWMARVKWVAVGRIVDLKNDLQPFANCGLKDRSACVHFNHARVTLKVEKMEKGVTAANGQLLLAPHYCGKGIPLDLDTSKRYRFFGNDDRFFETYEVVLP
jgi:hypothetical protein